MGIRIITDSTADISQDEAKKLGISVVPLKTVFEDGVYLDGIDLKPEEFFQKQAASKNLPTTTQPAPHEFEEVYRNALDDGDSIIVILISSVLSGTVQSALIAKNNCGGDISVIDSETTTIGLRILVELAISLRDRGVAAAEIVRILETEKSRVSLFAVVDTLEYLKKGGRLSKTAALAGTLLDVKPIIYLKKGALGVKSKVRGLKNARKEVMSLAQEDGIDMGMPVSIGYTGSRDTFEAFQTLFTEQFPKLSPLVSTIGSVISTHVGPGAAAVAYFKK